MTITVPTILIVAPMLAVIMVAWFYFCRWVIDWATRPIFRRLQRKLDVLEAARQEPQP